MSGKPTRSNTDLRQTSIDKLGLTTKVLKQVSESMEDLKETNVNQDKLGGCAVDNEVDYGLGHDVDDQPQQARINQTHPVSVLAPVLPKFDGNGNGEQWLKIILEKLDSIGLPLIDRRVLISEILVGDALIWYAKHNGKMPDFFSFMREFLQYYGNQHTYQQRIIGEDVKARLNFQDEVRTTNDSVAGLLRNQMLMTTLEKLPKFTGRSKQNVTKWLRETQQSMHLLQLSESEKLFFVPTCLDGDARDWFFDNSHLMSDWTLFIQKLIKTFEPSSKADISFNRLRHYEQGYTQDVRQYYFEVLKLCKEANSFMDEASKLQYLKDGLKPSLRFDILLKNPTTPDEFLAYAQRIEELKSLDEKQDVRTEISDRVVASSTTPSYQSRSMRPFQPQYSSTTNMSNESNRVNQNIPTPPYQCYRCGSYDHFIRDCPHFQ